MAETETAIVRSRLIVSPSVIKLAEMSNMPEIFSAHLGKYLDDVTTDELRIVLGKLSEKLANVQKNMADTESRKIGSTLGSMKTGASIDHVLNPIEFLLSGEKSSRLTEVYIKLMIAWFQALIDEKVQKIPTV